jgi:hypothetical protein
MGRAVHRGRKWPTGFCSGTKQNRIRGIWTKPGDSAGDNNLDRKNEDSVYFWSVSFLINFCSSLQQPLSFSLPFSIPQDPQFLDVL